jgi:alkanesulfonate monooxygenase SsuD/methylene tetrahydromethanopterin reductase-like flavin-dependent oxidoreductase (luciferase family)
MDLIEFSGSISCDTLEKEEQMVEIGIMVEGQEDMTWERFLGLATTVEQLGFGSFFRSDHLTALDRDPVRHSLALWPSLAALAMQTKTIRFGPMVCSMTFRHPAILAKMAASVSDLSGGRLDLGIGAGWYQGEHEMFGIDFPRYGTRLKMLDEGAQVIRLLFAQAPANFHGEFYQLTEAVTYPKPHNLSIIMGGKGEKTLEVVARNADEWNCSYVGVDVFREKSRQLDDNCETIGRDPLTLRRSLMIPFVIARSEKGVQECIHAHRAVFSDLPGDLIAWHDAGFIGGTPQQVLDQMKAFESAGIARFMLQHNNLDDLDSLALMAEEVLPYL